MSQPALQFEFRFELLTPLRQLAQLFPAVFAEWPSRSVLNKEASQISHDDLQRILEFVSTLLATERTCSHVARFMRPILPVLYSTLTSAQITTDSIESISICTALLLPSAPHLITPALQFFENSRSRSLFSRLETCSDARSVPGASALRIARAALLLLRNEQARATLTRVWNWSPVFLLLQHPLARVRWHAASACAELLSMNESTRVNFVSRVLCDMANPQDVATFSSELDRLAELAKFDMIESTAQSVSSIDNALITFAPQPAPENASPLYLSAQDLNAFVVDIGGILLPKKRMVASTSSVIDALVPVSSSARALRAIALACCRGGPVLVTGPPGSGKSTLLSEVARLTGNSDLIHIHLDDQIDSKTLLGTYVCTDIPGEFRWQAGALTQAVQQGRWALLEDLDRAPFEVLSSIVSLLERRRLFLPGRGDVVEAAPGFQLFATRSTAVRADSEHTAPVDHSQGASILENHFSRVNLEPLSADDLRSIIRVKFPSLALYSAAILQTYASLALPTELLQTLSQMESTFAEDALPPSTSMLGGSHRLLLGTRRWTTRDLFKWCFRVAVIFAEQGKNLGSGGISLEEYIFAEALDCFAAPIPCARTRALLLHWLAGVWNLPSDRVEYYAKLYRPTIQVTNQLVSIGRVSLPRNEKLSTQLASTVYGGGSGFSHTTHSSRLLERLAVGIARNEPLLLVGETGNGKTTIIQHLAQQCGRRLLVQNLNQQTDSSDFLGGFKPVELRAACIPLMNAFGQLFPKTFSVAANSALAGSIKAAFDQKQWASLVVQMRRVIAMVDERFNSKDAATVSEPVANKRSLSGDDAASKRNISSALMDSWKQFSHTLSSFERQLEHLKSSFAFSFVEGTLVKAMREGCWLLLDEVNLATSETLERLSGVLDGANGSLVLLERGDTEALPRHPDFRLLASMNPPTDFGKKDLPPGIRNKMTELYVDEVRDRADLCVIVNAALRDCLAALSNKVVSVDDIVSLYLDCITAARGQLVDGSDQRPHYSVRSLTRALDYCRTHAAVYGFQRSLYEGFSLAFLMPLGLASRTAVETLMQNYILKGKSPKLLDQLPREPQNVDQLVQISSHWVKRGPESIKPGRKDFIMTPSITARVTDMARMLVAGKYPVLLQGPTSAGKTSVVVHLAQLTGHRCVRINNHEHTDLQEYMGAYVTGTDGKLRFQEGVLVEAVRNGYWIVLDELNLAPSEVLEALNRLLDDNRELFIPETQETVKPHPHFMLFATQNPPGLYGGRKVLSRAFRNRFIEMHVADIPEDELVQILHERCELAPKFCTAMVKVMKELQLRRQQSQVFAGKSGFITPRDLFRWGARCPTTEQELAEAGLMLLGERLRTDAEKEAVRAALSKHIKTTRNLSDEVALYHDRVPVEQLEALIATAIANGDESVRGLGEISWTPSMRRLYALLDASLRHQEPVLLVGETGCGKTTICQVLALLRAQQLHVLNCHQNTETSDFLGSLRPVRGKHQIQIEFRQRVLELFQAIDRARQAFVAHDMQVDSEASSSLWSFSGTVSCASLLDADGLEVEDIVPILHSVINQVTLACSSSDAVLQAMLSQTLELCPSQPEGQSLIESASNQLSSSLSINDAEPAEDKKARKQRLRREKLAALANERSVEEGGAAAPTSAVQTEQADESIEMESTNQQPAPAPLAFSEHACLSSNDISADTLRVLPVPALRILLNIFGLRARSRALFEWADGALVSAMRSGQMLLIDEISLADDAVLERLNSVLEPSRTLLLAEKGGDTAEEIVAASSFRVLATMNPGGDYGKKELSPALRNRFTEIWVAPISSRQDLLKIVSDRCANDGLRALAPAALDFVEWFNDLLGKKKILSVRDILSWVSFMNACFSVDDAAHGHSHTGSSRVSAAEAFVHGACMVLLDGLSIGTTESEQSASLLRTKCVQQLLRCLPVSAQSELSGRVGDDGLIMSVPVAPIDPTLFGVWPFFMRRGSKPASKVTFSMKAPSTGKNFMRVLRALQLPKAILLEGSPGVGKTSLITALAAASGHTVVRINLSEHTDMMDLLGSDMPVAGGRPGEFTWCDGVFLQALKAGSWVLLDELNLASQSVLEGLNAVLDHRASVYLPELDRTFACPSSFRVFAAQNPVAQGGGRKGLPRSFLNRFAKVYLEPLDGDDLRFIMCALHPQLHTGVIDRMVRFNQAIFVDTMVNRLYGRLGSPWEFNLRDMFRWCELMMTALSGVQSERSQSLQCESAFVTDEGAQLQACAAHVDLLYLQRMRAAEDRIKLAERFTSIFGFDPRVDSRAHVRLTARTLQIGHAWLQRRMGCDTFSTASARRDGALASVSTQSLHVLQSSRLPLEHLMVCVRQKWPVALMGPSGSGKTSLVRLLAQVCGKTLFELPMTAGADSTELLGCFEQVDVMRKQRETLNRLGALIEVISQRLLLLSSFNSVALSLDPCVASAAELIKLWSLVNQASTAVWDHSQNSVALSLLSAADRAVHTLLASENTHEIGDLQSNIIPNLKRDLESLLTLHRDGTLGRFEWLDGALVRALEHGHWVLLDQANLANASVLDRLNPLLEPDGVLMINECGIQGPDGQVRIVKPHPDFRLFLALDTSYGEVSRAMRNRCVEINLLPVTSNEIANQLSAFVPASLTIGDVELLINKFSGISSRKLAALLIQVHCEVGKAILQSKSVPFNTDEDCLHLAPVKRLLNWAALMSEQLHRGSDYYSSLRTSMEQAYSGVIRSAQLDDIFHAIYSRFNTNDIAASTSVDVSTAALILAGAKNIQPSEVARDALLPKRLSAFQNLSWMFSNQVSVLADSAVRASGSLLATVSFDSSLIEFLTYSCISYHVCAVYEAGLLDLQTLRNAVQRSQFNADSGESCSASDLLDLQVLRSLPDHIVSAVMGSTSQSLKLSSVQWKSDSTLALQHMKMALQLCANFVEQSSQSDLRVRAKLLSLLIEICNRVSQFTGSPLPWIASFLARTLHTLEALTESPVMRACVLVQTRVGELLNEPTLSLETLNLESNTPLWQYLSANASSHDQSSSESVSQLLQTWQMLQPVLTLQRARIARAFAESQTFTRALGQNSMLSRSAWSPLQQSAACHFGQLDKGRASHPFLSQFVSWITAMDDLIHRRLFLSTNTSIDQLVIRFNSSSLKDDIARISAWFVARDRCWDAVHGHSAFDDAVLEERSVISRRADVPVGDHSNTSLAIDLVHVRWRALSKRTRVLLQLLAASTSIEESNLHIHAVNLQSKLDSSLSAELSSLAAKDTLWKHGGHPFVPRSRQLGHVYSSLKQLDAYALQHSAADNPIKATDLAWKRILLDAFCHTRIAHEHHDRDAADALQSELESVPASLSERSAWVDRVKTAYAHMDRIEVQLAADEHAAKEFDDSDEDVDHDLDSDVEDDDPAKGVKMLNVSALIRRDEPIDLVLEPLQPLFSLSVVRSEFGLLARLNAALGSYRTLLASVAPEHTASFVRNPLRAAQLVGSSRMQAACSHWVAAVSTLPSQMHQIVNFAVHRLQHRRLQALSAYKNLAWRLESVVTQVGSVLDIIAQSSEVAMLEIDSVLSAWHSLMIHDFPSMLLDLQHAWLSDIVIVANSNSPTHVSSTVLHTASNLLSSAKSAWILSYLSKSKHTPIESRRTHRRGLRALVFHLCSNSSQQSEGDELAIAASLSGVLHSFAKAFPQESSCSFASVSLLCTQWTCVFGGPSVLPPSMLTAAALEAQLPIALAVLNACTDVRLQPLCPSLLSSMVRTLTAAATRKAENPVAPDFHSQLGCSLLWTQLGLLRAHLLTPARPFDPALKYQARSSDAASEQNDIGFELAARRWLAALTLGTLPLEPVAGDYESCQVANLQRQARALTETQNELAQHVTERAQLNTVTRRFAELFDETRYFTSAVADIQKVMGVARKLAKLASEQHDHAGSFDEKTLTANASLRSEEKLFQETAARFISRLTLQYGAMYEDFVAPLVGAVQQIQMGLQRLAAATAAPMSTNVETALLSLLEYPLSLRATRPDEPLLQHTLLPPLRALLQSNTLTDVDQLNVAIAELLQQSSATSSRFDIRSARLNLLRSVLARIQRLCSIAGDRPAPALLVLLDAIFQTLASTWRAARDEKARLAAEAEVLYKNRAVVSESETPEQMEQRKLKEMFPDFTSDFEDILMQDSAYRHQKEQELEQKAAEAKLQGLPAPAVQLNHQSMSITDDDVFELYRSYYAVYSSLGRSSVLSSGNDAWVEESAELSAQLIGAASDTLQQSLSACLDQSAAVQLTQLWLLARAHKQLDAAYRIEVGSNRSRAKKIQARAAAVLKEKKQKHKAIKKAQDELVADDAMMEEIQVIQLSDLAADAASTGGAIATASASFSSLATQFSLAAFPAIPSLHVHSTSSTFATSDLFRESNLGEVKLLEAPVRFLLERLRALLIDFPAHPILLQLVQLAQRLASLPVSIPLMKAVQGIELMLQKSEEWEAYASRQVSMRPQLKQLALLVARWRKIELNTWPQALLACERKFHARTLQLFFPLFALVMVKSLPKASESDTEATFSSKFESYLTELHSGLEQFVQSCSVGEFGTRLELLFALQSQLDIEIAAGIAASDSNTDDRLTLAARSRMSRTLFNVRMYYAQFLPLIQAHLASRRAPIAQKLSETAKLFSWDLSNYHSLRDSSEKSHLKVCKLAQEWEDVISSPVINILSTEEKKDAAPEPGSSGAVDDHVSFGMAEREVPSKPTAGAEFSQFVVALPSVESCFTKLSSDEWFNNSSVVASSEESLQSRLPSLLQRMRVLMQRGALSDSAVQSHTVVSSHVENMATTIIQRTQSLRGDNSNIKLRKRALVDLLKALKSSGLSYLSAAVDSALTSPTQLVQSQSLWNSLRVFEGSIDTAALLKPDFAQFAALADSFSGSVHEISQSLCAKSERYFFENQAMLRKLRERFTKFSSDLSRLEAIKSKGFIENLFSMFVQQRLELSCVSHQLSGLSYLWLHLASLPNQSTQIASSAINSASTSDVSNLSPTDWLGALACHVDSLIESLHHQHLIAAEMSIVLTSSPSVDISQTFTVGSDANSQLLADPLAQALLKSLVRDEYSESQSKFAPSLAQLMSVLNTQLAELKSIQSNLRVQLALVSPPANVLAFNGQHAESGNLSSVSFRQALSVQSAGYTSASILVPVLHKAGDRLRSVVESLSVFDSSDFVDVLPSAARTVLSDTVANSRAFLSRLTTQTALSHSTQTAQLTDADHVLVNNVSQAVEATVSQLLLVIQHAHKVVESQPTQKPVSEVPIGEDMDDDVLPDENADILAEHNLLLALLSSSKLPALVQTVQNLLSLLRNAQSTSSPALSICESMVRNLVPMVHQVSLLVHRAFLDALRLHKSCGKLLYVLLQLFNALYSRGFCRRPEEREGDGEEDTEDDVKGTGMGDGQGKKDVSDEIEDEEQLLGLKDQPPPPEDKNDQQQQKPDPVDNKTGKEMSTDFDGEMHDVAPEDQLDEDEEQPEEPEHQKEMGNVDNEDQEVVDERLWNSDDEEEEQNKSPEEKQEEKLEKDAPVHGGEDDDTEMMGKDDQPEDKKKKDDKADAKPKKEKQMTDEDDGPDEEFPELGDQEDDEQDAGANDDNVNDCPEDRTEENHKMDLELPDDLKLDQDEEAESAGAEEDAADEEDSSDQKNDESAEDSEMPALPEEKDAPQPEDAAEEGKEEIENKQAEGDADEDMPDADKEDGQAAETNEQPPTADQGQAPPEEEELPERPENHEAPAELNDKTKKEEIMGLKSNEQQRGDTALKDDAEQMNDQSQPQQQQQSPDGDDSSPQTQQQQATSMSTADQNWQAAAQPQSSSGQQRPKPDASQSNPYESLGDVSKKFRQRVELLQRNQDAVPMEEPESQQPQADESDKKDDHGLFEHVGENEKADDQALGSATQEQMEQMGQLDKEENAPTEPDQKEEKVEQRPDDSAANQDQEQASKSLVGGSARLNRPDQEDSEHESEEHDSEDVEMEDTPDTWLDEMLNRAEKPDTEMQESSIGNLQVSSSSSTALVPAAAAAPLDPEALERLRTELDDKLQAWQSGQDVNAVDLWRRFEQVTIELSMQLCEQLRIILEPSLATKLRGDYRTGKRINMKKVIPYIASQFRKDKIWLRRTKPSKRQYQVMIAIDDSESMRTNGAGRLALEALVVLCKALTQLEVGQLSVVSFGDDVQLLHPFDRPFTETSGAYALSAFKFDQAKTHWPRFLETAVTLLTEAKQDSSAGDEQLQLMFVISDARVQQDRETVARWTREAAERRQLLVLIVIDANATGPNSAQSILSLKSVTYPNGKIKVVEYLENFPFPYYIILRQLSALPEIVADALRQWFELIQSSK